MAVFKPFRAHRPTAAYADKVAALPYDVMNSDEARRAAFGNPYSFLHVDKAEIDLPRTVGLYDDRVYEKAAENLGKLISADVLVQDAKPCFYIYAQTRLGRVQTGLVGCASVDDYLQNVIKKHELTRADKEADRIRHVDTLDANTGPIFLTYRGVPAVTEMLEAYKQAHDAGYDFTADGVRQQVWVVADDAVMDALAAQLAAVPALYIADGHHRAASAVRVAEMRREAHPDYTGREEFNFFLSVLFPAEELEILDYNRVIRDLGGLSPAAFLEKLEASGDIWRRRLRDERQMPADWQETDNGFVVTLRALESGAEIFRLTLTAATKAQAKRFCERWPERAPVKLATWSNSHWPFLTQVWQSLEWLDRSSSTEVRRASMAIGEEILISKPLLASHSETG